MRRRRPSTAKNKERKKTTLKPYTGVYARIHRHTDTHTHTHTHTLKALSLSPYICRQRLTGWLSWGSVLKTLPANAGDTGDVGLIPGSERSPEKGKDNPLQYPCLENHPDSVHGVTEESDMI